VRVPYELRVCVCVCVCVLQDENNKAEVFAQTAAVTRIETEKQVCYTHRYPNPNSSSLTPQPRSPNPKSRSMSPEPGCLWQAARIKNQALEIQRIAEAEADKVKALAQVPPARPPSLPTLLPRHSLTHPISHILPPSLPPPPPLCTHPELL
jgi:hypothetical protein